MAAAKLPDAQTIYLSPSGKRCKFVPGAGQSSWMFFRYLDNAEILGEGFTLSWGNFSLMRVQSTSRGLPHAASR